MSTLAGIAVKDLYKRFLQLGSNNVSSSWKNIEDGDGNATGLYLKDTSVKVKALEFENTPSSAATGSVNALVNETGVVKYATVHTFGQSEKDPFLGYWNAQSTLTSITFTDGAQAGVRNNAATVFEDLAPSDIEIPYNSGTYLYYQGAALGEWFRITLEFTATPSGAWVTATDYFDIGLDTTGSGTMDKLIQTFICPKGASVAQPFTVYFEGYVTASIITNGFKILLKPVGADLDVTLVNSLIGRIQKR